jgi:hypothetical protein
MANTTTLNKIERAAKFLATPSAIAARNYLEPPYQLALLILDQFADGIPKDFEELSELTGINIETIRQYIRALKRGGYPLTVGNTAVKVKTGRKPVVISSKGTKGRR